MSGGCRVVAVGASWGGLAVLRQILGALPGDLDAAVLVAQHRGAAVRGGLFRDLLQASAALRVRETNDKDELRAATVYVAPPDYHLLVEDGSLSLSTEGPVLYARPSIDVLLESAAEAAYGERCAGVVLTGANADGARGLRRVAELGGTAIVQDPASAERAEMPAAALAAVGGARVCGVDEVAPALLGICGRSTA